jgi:hypothetical protein
MFNLKFYALAILSALAAIVGAYAYGRKTGEQAEMVDQQQRINKTRKVSREVYNDVNSKSDDHIRTGLRDKWTRK